MPSMKQQREINDLCDRVEILERAAMIAEQEAFIAANAKKKPANKRAKNGSV